ncbi:MAG: hypothetical protein JWM74_2550 [Myxococcaceae bacterium]|nr:hypothetical protein [Myxococcaceae bacterium]
MPSLRGFGLTFSSLVVSASVTLAAVWPTATMAGDQVDPFAVLADPTTKVGENVRVEGKIERDAKSKTGWVVVMKAENKGQKAETLAVQTVLERKVSNPMARVPSMPQVAWQNKETLTLAKGEVVTHRYELPAAIATALTANAAPPAPVAKNAKSPFMMARTTFGVRFQKADALGT